MVHEMQTRVGAARRRAHRLRTCSTSAEGTAVANARSDSCEQFRSGAFSPDALIRPFVKKATRTGWIGAPPALYDEEVRCFDGRIKCVVANALQTHGRASAFLHERRPRGSRMCASAHGVLRTESMMHVGSDGL
eukprot:1888686-Prymnesium_polylepis.1